MSHMRMTQLSKMCIKYNTLYDLAKLYTLPTLKVYLVLIYYQFTNVRLDQTLHLLSHGDLSNPPYTAIATTVVAHYSKMMAILCSVQDNLLLRPSRHRQTP